MLRSLRRFFRSSHPLAPENLGDRARDITFQVMEEEDIANCLSFYRANETMHFPPGRLDYYESKLRGREFLTLVAMRDAKPVGCCGIHYMTWTGGMPIGFFCFGMVDPAHQRRGVGTAQVLVRIALLPVTNDLAIAAMAAVAGSVPFYKRFGFDFSREMPGDDGGRYPFGLLRVSQTFLDDCRAELARRNITYPDVRDRIPHRKAANQPR